MTLPITGVIVRQRARDHNYDARRAPWYDGRVRRTLGKILLMALLVAGCTKPRTELVIGLMTDLSARDMVDQVTLTAQRSGVILFQQNWLISGVLSQPEELPGSFGIYSADGSEPLVTLTATGLMGTNTVVTRTAVTSLVHEQTLFMRMALVGECSTMPCAAGESCIEGVCVGQTIDSRRFPTYATDMEKTLQCDSGPKYRNTSTKLLLAIKGDCAANEDCIEGTCYKRVGAGDGGSVTLPDMAAVNCNPVKQTGCPTGEKCYVGAGGATACKAIGAKALGEACTSGVGDDCAAGLHCATDGTPAVCRQYCLVDGDCTQMPSASGSEAEPTNVARCYEGLAASTFKLCSISCDPVSANMDDSCPTGRTCGFFTTNTTPSNVFTDCYTSMNVAAGAACSSVNDCAAGLTCASSGSGTPHCQPTCRPDQAGDCISPNSCPALAGVSNPIFSACCPAAGC